MQWAYPNNGLVLSAKNSATVRRLSACLAKHRGLHWQHTTHGPTATLHRAERYQMGLWRQQILASL